MANLTSDLRSPLKFTLTENKLRTRSNSLFRLLLAILSQNPSILHDIMDIRAFALLVVAPYEDTGELNLDHALAAFFGSPSLDSTDHHFRLSLPATAFAEYLRCLGIAQLRPVVLYMLDALQAFMLGSTALPTVTVYQETLASCVQPYLRFLFRLIHHHQPLSDIFMQSGVIEVLEGMWVSWGLRPANAAQSESSTALSLSCLMIVGALSLYHNLVHRAISSKLGDCLLEVRLRQKGGKYHQIVRYDNEMSHIGGIGSMAGLEAPILDLVLKVVDSKMSSSLDSQVHLSQFENLLDILS